MLGSFQVYTMPVRPASQRQSLVAPHLLAAGMGTLLRCPVGKAAKQHEQQPCIYREATPGTGSTHMLPAAFCRCVVAVAKIQKRYSHVLPQPLCSSPLHVWLSPSQEVTCFMRPSTPPHDAPRGCRACAAAPVLGAALVHWQNGRFHALPAGHCLSIIRVRAPRRCWT